MLFSSNVSGSKSGISDSKISESGSSTSIISEWGAGNSEHGAPTSFETFKSEFSF